MQEIEEQREVKKYERTHQFGSAEKSYEQPI